MSDSLAIKGVGDALLISVPAEEGQEALATLLGKIDERVDFFRGAHLAIDFTARDVGAAELGDLRDALSERLISLQTVLSTSVVTLKAAADLGLETTLRREPSIEVEDQPLVTELDGEQAAFVQRTMRSGNSIQHPGHVVVLGDVNPGAEITAGGNVIVWGRLRGVVHAGAAGDETAVVCALDLSPAQLRIAGQIALSPERKGEPRPEVARIRDGQLVAEPWALTRMI
jgi:septum site-determining protein MinC